MIRINTLDRYGKTLTLELMGYINKTEFDILYDCLQAQIEEGIKLGLTLRFQQLDPAIQSTLKSWGLEAWVDDE